MSRLVTQSHSGSAMPWKGLERVAGEAKRRALANTPEAISERWRKAVGKGLLIGQPIFGGLPCSENATALASLQVALAYADAPHGIMKVVNESLVPRARNAIASHFVTTKEPYDFEWLLQIDADIVFRPEDVLALLESGHEVVGGAYPRKQIEWKAVTDAARAGFGAPERWASSYVVNLLPEDAAEGAATFDDKGCVEVLDLPTGFLLIHRSVLEQMREVAKQERDDVIASLTLAVDTAQCSEAGKAAALRALDCVSVALAPLEYETDDQDKRPCWNFFPTPVAFEGGRWRYLSEDYGFCRLWQSMGGKCYLHPGLELHHIGRHVFQANRDLVMEGACK